MAASKGRGARAGKTKKAPKEKIKTPMKGDADRVPGAGHNLTELKKALAPGFRALFDLQDEMDSRMGEFRVDFKNKYAAISDASNIPRAIIREIFNDMKAERRKQARNKEREQSARDLYDAACAALDGTPLGLYLVESGFQPPEAPAHEPSEPEE